MNLWQVRFKLRNVILKTIAAVLLSGMASLALAEQPPVSQMDSSEAVAQNTTALQLEQASYKDCTNLGYKVTLFSPCGDEDGARLWRQTKIMAVAGVGVAAFIAILPEEISGWERGTWERGALLDQWYENVKAGPVWDNDVWYINLIGHPYFGGVYYQAARKSGYNEWNSFTYSALMSTFYWEYGLEAFAEVPSIQDLVVTPVGGWLYGEWAHQKEKQIRRNGNLAMGSEFWGSVALFLLDPVGSIDDWCCASKKVEVTAFNIARWPAQRYSPDVDPGKDYWGIKFAVAF